jgi:precorrin-2 dehydrogenase/sirohydrochlorin ferrochelatase
MLNLRGCAVVVVGGGRIATRKVADLVAAGARVTVVSPTVSARLAKWVRDGRLRHRDRAYRSGDLKGCRLAIAATSDPREQARIAKDARAVGAWVNVVDQPALCDFLAPALLRRGDLTITVSTEGRSPALARWLKERLDAVVGAEYARLTSLLAAIRAELRAIGASPNTRRRMTDRLLDGGLPALVRANDHKGIARLIRRAFGVETAAPRPRGGRTERRATRSHRGPSIASAVR